MTESPDDREASFSVLFVCTGNLCRSPYMEYVVADGLRRRAIDSVSVSSAGVLAVDGHRVSPTIREMLDRDGIDAGAFRARTLTPRMIRAADLIITAERAHRESVVRSVPVARQRVFTLRQAGRLLARTSDIRLEVPVTSRLLSGRGLAGSGGPDDDVDDPWRRPRRAYLRSVEQMQQPLALLIESLKHHSALVAP